MKRCTVLTWLGCCFAPTAVAAEKPLAEAARIAAERLKAGCIVTGDVKGGNAVFSLAGKAPEGGESAPERVLFEIGSISKTFTGLLLAQAVVEGKVKLETTVGELLGDGVTFADPRVAAITLVQLSTHTSGLPRLAANHAAGVAKDDPYAKYDEKLLLEFLTQTSLKGEGPFRSSYSNVGAGLLGHLLAKVYGKSWEEAVVEKICQPLGLTHTRVDVKGLGLIMAQPHSGAKASHNWSFDALAGAGALRSTAADMVKYGQAVLHPEKTPLQKALALALQPHAASGATGGEIGLGFFIRKLEGDTVYSHDGGTGGYASLLRVIPARELVQVVVLNNTTLHGSEVLAVAAGAPPKKKAEPPAKEMKLTLEELRRFPGIYEVDQDTRFTVLMEEKTEQLWVRLTGQPFLRVFAKTPNQFFYKAVEAEIQFQQADGKVKALTLFQNGEEITAERTGEPPAITLKTAEELKPYVGKYRLMGLQDLTVTVRGNTLFAQLEGQPALPVFATGPDRFDYDVVEAAVVFTRDEAKEINGLTLLQNGQTLPAPKKAEKRS